LGRKAKEAKNVIVTGWSETVGGYVPPISDYVTVKYDSSGSQMWVNTFHQSGWANNEGKAIAVDINNNIYVTGHSFHAEDYSDDYLTFIYSSQGEEIGRSFYDSPER